MFSIEFDINALFNNFEYLIFSLLFLGYVVLAFDVLYYCVLHCFYGLLSIKCRSLPLGRKLSVMGIVEGRTIFL